jgi:hypothetical protein
VAGQFRVSRRRRGVLLAGERERLGGVGHARRVEAHGAHLLVEPLLPGSAGGIGVDEVRCQHADAVVEVPRVEELAEPGEGGDQAFLVFAHRRRVIDHEHEVDLAAAGAVDRELAPAADGFHANYDAALRSEMRVVLVDRVIAEALLADEAGVGCVGQLAGGAIEASDAVPRGVLRVQHVGHLRGGDEGPVGW